MTKKKSKSMRAGMIQMPIRVRPEVRDALDRFAARVFMSREALVRVLLEGLAASLVETEKAQKSGLFNEFSLDVERAMEGAIERALTTPPLVAGRAGVRAGVHMSGSMRPKRRT